MRWIIGKGESNILNTWTFVMRVAARLSKSTDLSACERSWLILPHTALESRGRFKPVISYFVSL